MVETQLRALLKLILFAPDFTDEGYARTGYGSRGTWFIEAAKNFELSDQWAARVSLKHNERDAWVDNLTTGDEVGGYDEFAYRLQLMYDNGADTRAWF